VKNETHERRLRVRELWGKPNAVIAEILLEEGFKVDGDRRPRSKAAREEWETKRLDAMRRKVWNDRDWWRQRWLKRSEPKTVDDLYVARQEHVASLETDLEEIHEMIDDGKIKSTAKVMLIGERRQTRSLLAKARGVDAPTAGTDGAGDDDPESIQAKLFILEVPSETAGELREQGVEVSRTSPPEARQVRANDSRSKST
jgi:hypothetical protein